MDSELRQQLVVGAALVEGDATDDVVAVLVGQTVELQLGRSDVAGCGVRSHRGMVAVEDAVLAGHIEGASDDSLIHGPVELHPILRATQHAVIVGGHVLVCQGT